MFQMSPMEKSKQRKQIMSRMVGRVLSSEKRNEKLVASLLTKKTLDRKKSKPREFGLNKPHSSIGKKVDWVKKDELVRKNSVKHKVVSHYSQVTSAASLIEKREKGIMTFLPAEALATICSFDMNNMRLLMAVCAQWHCKIRDGFDQQLKRVENEFIKTNSEFLLFKESYLSSQPIHFCGKDGLRIDRAISCEIIPNKKLYGKTLNFSYQFQYYGDKKKYFRYEYIVDIVKKKPRLIWMHYDQDNKCSYAQTIS